ncbi:anti-sigma factor family protein [Streptomyces sp. NPDC001339]|uniref:anti-sigma factor family protein n=1 Tax=Streptomyces sp. NPDC001339 TaxID=3364563 RepID=UPI0036A1F06A
MTSTTGTGEHPEVSEISELSDGLLSLSRTADLRDHLAACELCEDVYASLEEIRGLLGTLPGPPRMPTDITERIDAALAAEALLDATSPGSGGQVSRETVATSVSASHETEDVPLAVSRETGTAAVSVSRETGAGTDTEPETASRGRGTPSGRPARRRRGATGPGRGTPNDRSPRARRRPRILLVTAAAAAVLSVGGLLVQHAVMDGTRASQGEAIATPKQSSDGLTAASLGAHVRDLLASKRPHTSPGIGARSSPDTPLRGDTDAVPVCVRQGIGRSEAPLVSSRIRYQGKDAFLVVLPDPADLQRVSAYVVASSCASATPPAPGKVLLSRSYQRD